MKIIISTQCYENYAWNEDGTLGVGENAYWKAKGGSDYIIENVPVVFAANGDVQAFVRDFVDRNEIECYGEGYREHVIGWSIEDDDFVTWFEAQQLEHEGKVTYFDKRFQFAEA
jgi:hypothetical protein